MAHTILVVDDEVNVRTMLKDYLTGHGFQVATAGDGQQALFTARLLTPDLILLDVMMPVMDGYEFIRTLRRESNAPIILVTACSEETDKIVGLELGADDFVVKPFHMRELLARIRAVLRRSQPTDLPAPKQVLRVAGITLDRTRHHVRVGSETVDLTPKEFELLATLMKAPGRVYSRSQLLEEQRGSGWATDVRTIDVHIRNLRTKIEADPRSPRYIQTVRGFGYRFVEE